MIGALEYMTVVSLGPIITNALKPQPSPITSPTSPDKASQKTCRLLRSSGKSWPETTSSTMV
jgi:hypothetical protein